MNAIREKVDAQSASGCDAHISLTLPLPGPLREPQCNELKRIASTIQPFTIHYGPLMNYLPHPGVCLAIEPQDKLDLLRTALEAAPVFEGAPQRRYPFSAHMTLAEFVTVDRSKELMVELQDTAPAGDFLCTAVSYAVPDENFRFTERGRLMLA
ncbi:2'-5' RNA ligase family protein [Paenibacillus spongiae]|uniref:2'-5' RNA ligase family protein n=1 Tax=Paenibacillus spongiae TaxID=2909671 RepID=A0ABY5S5W3_9BACL|nr:2'-5' RNA ligase family protein [Paenibacillus spongiae]UVI29306.1 2'-5' RNA ligase family protein [Paenibacillus spongiae]